MLSVLSALFIVTFPLTFVSTMDADTVDLLTPSKAEGESCGYESCPRIRPGELNVHLVPSTHFEVGQSATFEDHFTGRDDFYDTTVVTVKNSFDHVIQELWENDNRKFTISDIAYFFHWWSKRDHTVRRMVYTLLRQGRLSLVGGGFVIPDEATTSYQAIIETFTYALRMINSTFLQCGRPLVSWQVDVLGHSREMASLLAQMGFDGHFISAISFDEHIARMQRQGMEFLWRGSDDIGINSDIYTHVLFDGYRAPPGFCFSTRCSDPLIIVSDSAVRNDAERAKAFVQSMRYRQSPHYNTSNVLVVMGSQNGYFDARTWFNSIDNLIYAVNGLSSNKGKNVNAFYSTPYCYLRAVHEAKPALETKQDDFYPFAGNSNSYGTGFYTTAPPVKLLVREAMQYLHAAKQLQVLAKLYNNDRKFEELQWIFALFQDHTVITGNMRDYVKKNYVRRLFEATQRTLLIMKQAFNKMRKSPSGTIYYNCQYNMSICNVGDKFLVIYNPLSWPVTLPIRIPSYKSIYRVYNSKGQEIQTSMLVIRDIVTRLPGRTTDLRHELVFMAEDIPPLGFRSYFLESHAVRRHAREAEDDTETESKQRKKRSAPKHYNEFKTTKETAHKFQNNRNANDTETQINIKNYDTKVHNIEHKPERSKTRRRTRKNKMNNNNLKNKNRIDGEKIRRTKRNNTDVHKMYKITDEHNITEVHKTDKIVNKHNKTTHNVNRKGIKNNKYDDVRRLERAFVEMNPEKMSIIKKINKEKGKKKYLIVSHADQNQNINEQPLISDMESDYEYFDEDLKNRDTTVNETSNATTNDKLSDAPETRIGEAISNITDSPATHKTSVLDSEDSDIDEVRKTIEIHENPQINTESNNFFKEENTEQIRTFEMSENPQNNPTDENYDSSHDTDNKVFDSEKHSITSTKNVKELLEGVRLKSKESADVQEKDVDKPKLDTKDSKSEINEDATIKTESKKNSKDDITEQIRKTFEMSENPQNNTTDEDYDSSNGTDNEVLDSKKHNIFSTKNLKELLEEVRLKSKETADVQHETYVDKPKLDTKDMKSKIYEDASIKTEKPKISNENSKSQKVLNEMRKEAHMQLNSRRNDEKIVNHEGDNRNIDTELKNNTIKTKESYNNAKSSENKKSNFKTTTHTYDIMAETKNYTADFDIKKNTSYVPHKVVAEKKIDGRKKFRYDADDEVQGLYEISKDNFIENKYVKLTLDPTHRKINGMRLSNGLNISLDMQFYYYASDDPDRTYNYKWSNPDESEKEAYQKKAEQTAPPGVYLFRSIDNKPVPILDYLDVKVLKTDIVQEVQYHYADYASLSVRLYVDSPVVETDWIVGPIPFTADTPEYLGTDIFIRYMTDLESEGVFYTDANGRQTIKRIRDMRPTYEHVNRDPVAGNFYPVTSKISIVDEARNIRLSILTDRAQGGASLADGEVDLMLQRRICTDDQNRLAIFANDTEFGKPIWVRGTHHLYLSKDDYKQNRIFEKKLAKELQLSPIILTSKSYPYGEKSKETWSKHVNEYSYLQTKLPIGVHLLTLQEWNDHTILIRLENYLEKSDAIKTGVKTVILRDLFKNLKIKSIKETTLAGNVLMKDFMPLLWKKKDKFLKSFNDFYATGKPIEWADDNYSLETDSRVNTGIVLKPQQIRTFVCEFDYVQTTADQA